MRSVLLAIAILMLTGSPSLAAGGSNDYNPQQLLMRAYHQNVMNFGRVLEKAAQQGDTVPSDVARAAVSEMRRSTEEMEKYRAAVVASMPEARRPGMRKMMDEHLVSVKTHLRQLDDLTKKERIPSQEVLQHVEAIFTGCDQMPCGLHQGPGHGKGMHRGRGMGLDCQQSGNMMPEHRKMMQEMTQKLKAQDADLIQRVEKLKHASEDEKVAQLSEIVSLIVQQRAAVTAQMERMQQQAIDARLQRGPASPPPPNLGEVDDDDDDLDAGDTDGPM